MKSKLLLIVLIGLASVQATAQSKPPEKDIPAIAKAANGAVVKIVMAAGDDPISEGTGFLASPDGVIVTNYHVVQTGTVAVAKFPDGTMFIVDGVLDADKVRDLAVIKIHGKTFRTLTLGNSDRVQVGEAVVAIGNPLSLESTVSNGIVSGIRVVEERGGKFLQTTAPISPGSSGGPLFNMQGEVIGINTLYLEGGENLNFAIPINDAKRFLSGQSVLRKLPNESEEKLQQTQTPKADPFPIPTLSQLNCKDLQKEESVALSSEDWELSISEAKEYLNRCLPAHKRMQVTTPDGKTIDMGDVRDGIEAAFLVHLAVVYNRQKDFESAFKASKRCSVLDTDATEAYCLLELGKALQGLGRTSEAKKTFEQISSVCNDPSNNSEETRKSWSESDPCITSIEGARIRLKNLAQ